MSKEQKVLTIGIVLIVISVGLLIFSLTRKPAPTAPAPFAGGLGGGTPAEKKDCTVKEVETTVMGESLRGLIESGSKIKVLENYYSCQKVEREDIIAYRYGGSTEPLIKIVKAVPGDKFSLKKSDSGWNIMVNGKVVVNSEKKPYNIGDAGYRMISLYVKDYEGVIPDDAYLILGNDPAGSLDSTIFGLAGKSDFIGKVVK